MTKYELKEFKAWLEEKPERKEGLTGWDYTPLVWEEFFTKQPADYYLLKQPAWNNPKKLRIVQQWMAEIDQRERERERERERAGGKQ